LFNSS